MPLCKKRLECNTFRPEKEDCHDPKGYSCFLPVETQTEPVDEVACSAGLCTIDREDFLDRLDKGEVKWNYDECQFAKQLAKEGVIEYVKGWLCGYYQRVRA
jgi:hypothetical protein